MILDVLDARQAASDRVGYLVATLLGAAGHELNPRTTFMRKPTPDRSRGKRVCKACHCEKQRRYLARKRGGHLAS